MSFKSFLIVKKNVIAVYLRATYYSVKLEMKNTHSDNTTKTFFKHPIIQTAFCMLHLMWQLLWKLRVLIE